MASSAFEQEEEEELVFFDGSWSPWLVSFALSHLQVNQESIKGLLGLVRTLVPSLSFLVLTFFILTRTRSKDEDRAGELDPLALDHQE